MTIDWDVFRADLANEIDHRGYNYLADMVRRKLSLSSIKAIYGEADGCEVVGADVAIKCNDDALAQIAITA